MKIIEKRFISMNFLCQIIFSRFDFSATSEYLHYRRRFIYRENKSRAISRRRFSRLPFSNPVLRDSVAGVNFPLSKRTQRRSENKIDSLLFELKSRDLCVHSIFVLVSRDSSALLGEHISIFRVDTLVSAFAQPTDIRWCVREKLSLEMMNSYFAKIISSLISW